MTEIINFYSRHENIQMLIYKRDLLNMKLNLSILNKEEEQEIESIRREIKRITKIIGDSYIDSYERLENDVKEIASDILSAPVTESNAYTHAIEIEEYILNQNIDINIEDFEIELTILYGSYEQLGYFPQNTKKDISRIRKDSLATNKRNYINQVLYNLAHNKEPNDILELLRKEITRKTKKEAINKVNSKKLKLC